MATLNIEALLEKRPADESVRGLLRVGQVVDAWKVVAFVGAGRSAEVYRVINTRIGGEAALKLLVDEAFGLKARFVLETDVLRSVAVAGLPHFFGSGVVGGRSYYVMEYLQPLIIPLATKAILPFMTALAKTVGELHEAGDVLGGQMSWPCVAVGLGAEESLDVDLAAAGLAVAAVAHPDVILG